MRKYEWRVQEVVTSYQKHKENNPLLCEATLSVGGSVAACREMKLRTTLVFMFPSLATATVLMHAKERTVEILPSLFPRLKRESCSHRLGRRGKKTNTCHGYGC